MKIVISPFSNGKAKNYPYWQDLIKLLANDGHNIIQIGSGNEQKFNNVHEHLFDLPFNNLKHLIYESITWISVDNFLQHFNATLETPRRGTVIWSLSDPNIFGYDTNNNILKNRKYLRKNQFDVWHNEPVNFESFYKAHEIYAIMKKSDSRL